MARINELQERNKSITEEIDKLLSVDLTDDSKKQVRKLEKEFDLNKDEIEIKKDQAERSRSTTYTVNDTKSFRNWLTNSLNASPNAAPGSYTMRATTLQTTTEAGIINKNVGAVDVLYSPSEETLKSLGATFYTKLNGDFVMPVFDQVTAVFVAEGADASTANITPTVNTMKPQRVSSTYTISRELIVNTNPDVINKVEESLYNGIWNAIADRYFDTLDVDASTQYKTIKGSTIALTDFVGMEASLGRYNLTKTSYVMSPETKSYLKETPWTTNQEPIWKDDKVNGRPAHESPSVNGEEVIFGDFSKTAVGLWGDGITVIVDPFTRAKQGELVLTATAFADTAVYNKKAFILISDASTY
jgi:HK97 family phage major capsid protein